LRAYSSWVSSVAVVSAGARSAQSTTAEVSAYGRLPTSPNGSLGGTAPEEVLVADRAPAQRPGHRRVDLVRDHLPAERDQGAGEPAATGTHLVHQIVGFDGGRLDHRADGGRIVQEVLT
jgi:hypothetical protein